MICEKTWVLLFFLFLFHLLELFRGELSARVDLWVGEESVISISISNYKMSFLKNFHKNRNNSQNRKMQGSFLEAIPCLQWMLFTITVCFSVSFSDCRWWWGTVKQELMNCNFFWNSSGKRVLVSALIASPPFVRSHDGCTLSLLSPSPPLLLLSLSLILALMLS